MEGVTETNTVTGNRSETTRDLQFIGWKSQVTFIKEVLN